MSSSGLPAALIGLSPFPHSYIYYRNKWHAIMHVCQIFVWLYVVVGEEGSERQRVYQFRQRVLASCSSLQLLGSVCVYTGSRRARRGGRRPAKREATRRGTQNIQGRQQAKRTSQNKLYQKGNLLHLSQARQSRRGSGGGGGLMLRLGSYEQVDALRVAIVDEL